MPRSTNASQQKSDPSRGLVLFFELFTESVEAVDLEELLDSLEESADAGEEGALLPVPADLVRGGVHEVVLLHGLVLQDQIVCRLLQLLLFLQNKNTIKNKVSLESKNNFDGAGFFFGSAS
jgi:hypothetical protein